MSGVVIGGIVLRAFEVPEQISFGGQQRLAVHRLPGGARVIDAMGSDDRNIDWSGMMIGEDAADRARLLDGLRESGEAVSLVFGDMAFDVVVASFEAAYRRVSWIGTYRISCLVVPGVLEQAFSLSEQLTANLSDVGFIDPAGVVVGLANAVTVAQTALSGSATLVTGTSGTAALVAALQSASAVASIAQTTAEGAMSGLIASASSTDGAVGGSVGLQAVSLQAEQLAKSGVAFGLLGQAVVNLAAGAA